MVDGKDSNVLLWLSPKAFFGEVPYPLLHIDATYEFPEMLEFREWAIKQYGINVIAQRTKLTKCAVIVRLY